jgi:hypothetical protein
MEELRLSGMKFHGFDDSGSRYNAEGNLVDWWTAGTNFRQGLQFCYSSA